MCYCGDPNHYWVRFCDSDKCQKAKNDLYAQKNNTVFGEEKIWFLYWRNVNIFSLHGNELSVVGTKEISRAVVRKAVLAMDVFKSFYLSISKENTRRKELKEPLLVPEITGLISMTKEQYEKKLGAFATTPETQLLNDLPVLMEEEFKDVEWYII